MIFLNFLIRYFFPYSDRKTADILYQLLINIYFMTNTKH